MSITAVVGKNFGDEGKGLATDYLAMLSQKADRSCIVVRHNGGAQAGHTVERKDKRFVFRELSSGSMRGAVTFWAETFMPDLYKLSEEKEQLMALGEKIPKIISVPDCSLTYIDDVLINMSLETRRGDKRHGSCGMGIDEASRRSSDPEFKITPYDILSSGAEAFFKKLLFIRKEYLPARLEVLNLDPFSMMAYGEMLRDRNVLYKYSEQMCRNCEHIRLLSEDILTTYDDIIFEGAQGLMLDEKNIKYAPHLTSSRTGLTNPDAILRRLGITKRATALYVTRTYVTRHGAGDLPYEDIFLKEGNFFMDETNIKNEWQGSLRFAPHGSEEEFNEYVRPDIKDTLFTPALLLTHVDETEGNVLTVGGDVPVDEWIRRVGEDGLYRRVFTSSSRYAEDIKECYQE